MLRVRPYPLSSSHAPRHPPRPPRAPSHAHVPLGSVQYRGALRSLAQPQHVGHSPDVVALSGDGTWSLRAHSSTSSYSIQLALLDEGGAAITPHAVLIYPGKSHEWQYLAFENDNDALVQVFVRTGV